MFPEMFRENLRNFSVKKLELPPKLLQLVAHQIAPALSFLFQQSYNCGVVPTQWRQALVAPIHKSGLKSDPSNYRPISLTCICCKVIGTYCAQSPIKTPCCKQHPHRSPTWLSSEAISTTTQLTSVVHDWSSILQKRSQVDIVFLDFQKAFEESPTNACAVNWSTTVSLETPRHG